MQRTYVKAWIALLTLILALLLDGCGYKPSAQAIKSIFSDKIYVEVEVDRVEPENAPFLKDEMNRMVYTRFKGHLVPKEYADTKILISYAGTTFTPLTYANGYISRYRATVTVRFDLTTPKGNETKVITAIYESEIKESSLQSMTLRIEAIRKAMEKALDEFLAYASAKGTLSAGK
ncbi:MAG TPA: LPS assembly lipoprotein LptE [Sulfurovum sp.]|nr:LPS assembly lipoprotein LptE [Sulfurovum sp.]